MSRALPFGTRLAIFWVSGRRDIRLARSLLQQQLPQQQQQQQPFPYAYSAALARCFSSSTSGSSSSSSTGDAERSRGQQEQQGRQRSRSSSSSSGGNSSSFIRMVLSQVQDDLEKNPELRKAVEDLKASALTKKTQSVGSRLQGAASAAAEAAAAAASSTQQHTGRMMRRLQQMQEQVAAKHQQLRDKAMENDTCRAIGRHSSKVFSGAAAAAAALQQLATRAASAFKEEPVAKQKAAQWRQRMAIKRYKQQAELQQQEQQQEQQQQDTYGEEPRETALVLSNETAWDRFGSRLRDMPFLQNFFENPLLGQLFKETEVARSIREMKAIDPTFRLSELHELVQSVVAEHIVSAYLLGDEETLRLHCGEGAFAALKASIDERNRLQLRLDPSILLLGQVELVGARGSGMDSGDSPWFVYTFEAQQINCLRAASTGQVVQGAKDDIRRVIYSIAISRHAEPETPGLLYPWVIREIAIVGNEPVW